MRYCVLCVMVCLGCIAVTQQPAPTEVKPPDAQELLTREFGKSFTVAAGIPPMFGDMDGDGLEDAVLVVTSPSPLVDEVDFHYRAIDPYDSYWGWGNPKETVQFSATNAGPLRYIAIIHNWRTPKAKFLIINLPFEKVLLSRVTLKKKPTLAVHTIESSSLEADLFWDGKKYKWNPAYIGN